MKLAKTLVFLLFCVTISLNAVLVNNAALEKTEEAQEQKCENPCTACQRVVYQIKFQGMADCEVNGACRNTCYKIREMWGTAFNPFEPFVKDMFGKCEICFRAGHCTISQCKDQEHAELEIINHVVNTAHLTAKISPDLLVNFPDINTDPKALPHVQKVNQQVEHQLSKGIKTAVSIGTTQQLIPQVQNLVSNYFDKPHASVAGGVFQVLNNGGPNAQPTTGANVNFWNEGQPKPSASGALAHKAIAGLDKNVSELNKLKAIHGDKHLTTSLKKVARKEKGEITKAIKKFKKVEKKTGEKRKEN